MKTASPLLALVVSVFITTQTSALTPVPSGNAVPSMGAAHTAVHRSKVYWPKSNHTHSGSGSGSGSDWNDGDAGFPTKKLRTRRPAWTSSSSSSSFSPSSSRDAGSCYWCDSDDDTIAEPQNEDKLPSTSGSPLAVFALSSSVVAVAALALL